MWYYCDKKSIVLFMNYLIKKNWKLKYIFIKIYVLFRAILTINPFKNVLMYIILFLYSLPGFLNIFHQIYHDLICCSMLVAPLLFCDRFLYIKQFLGLSSCRECNLRMKSMRRTKVWQKLSENWNIQWKLCMTMLDSERNGYLVEVVTR